VASLPYHFGDQQGLAMCADAVRTSSRLRHGAGRVSASTPEPGVDDSYAGTRAFWCRHGFEPVWEPEGWWSEQSQAVLMVRALNRPPAGPA
jgi:hypothetical protein